VALFCLFFPHASRAVIGETQEMLYKRYGAGKEVGGQMLYTVQDKYSLSVYFNNGKNASMDVYTLMPKVDGTHDKLSDEDIQALLVLEGANLKWKKLITKAGEPTWEREDGQVIARIKNAPDQKTQEMCKTLVFVDTISTAAPVKTPKDK